jgi:hypothetical protein
MPDILRDAPGERRRDLIGGQRPARHLIVLQLHQTQMTSDRAYWDAGGNGGERRESRRAVMTNDTRRAAGSR